MNPWTDDDVATLAALFRSGKITEGETRDTARAFLDALAPRVAELQRAEYERGWLEGLEHRRLIADFQQGGTMLPTSDEIKQGDR